MSLVIDGDRSRLAQPLAQRVDQRRLAGADRAADADTQGSRHRMARGAHPLTLTLSRKRERELCPANWTLARLPERELCPATETLRPRAGEGGARRKALGG